MIAISSLLVTLTLSLLVTRAAAMAFMLTGLSREAARFQARSAFSGVGYTTSESESIVNHPVRRQIVMGLMLLGNIGVATVVATTMVSFIDIQKNEQTSIHADDVLVLYGPIDRLSELDQRRAGRRGDEAHQEAVTEHKDVLVEQEEVMASESNGPTLTGEA